MLSSIERVGPFSFYFAVESYACIGKQNSFQFLFLFWWDWNLNLGLRAHKAGILLIDPHFQSILFWLFWRWGVVNYLPGLVSNHDPPDLSLPRS
jgi:hypothetical protein